MRIAGAVILLAVVAVLGGYFWFQNFLRSERFREMVNTKVGGLLEVEGGFSKFRWDGMEVRAPEFRTAGEGMIRRLDADGVETEVRFAPLLSRKVEAQTISARRLEVELDVTRDGPRIESGGGQAFTFTEARIDEVDGMIAFGSTSLRWDGVQAELRPGPAVGSYDATLTRGRLLTPLALFPELGLDEAALRYSGGALFLQRGDWSVFESGRLATRGEIDFASGRYTITGDLAGVQCEEVLPDDWQKRLRGELSSEFAVRGEGKAPPVVSGALALVHGSLTALPVLDRIAAYTATERFRRLVLREATLDFRHEGPRLELTNIALASEGLLRIEGWLTIEDGHLDGELQLGVTPTTLARIPGAAERVFESGKEGMHWSPVRITGTTTLPKEDLSERLIAAGFAWMYEMVDGELVLKESGKAAGALAKGVWETAGQAGKIGVGILERGSDLLNSGRVPNPLDTVRDGVGGVLDGILGNPGSATREEEGGTPQPPPGEGMPLEEDPEARAKEEANEAIERQEGRSIDEKAKSLIDGVLGVD